MSPTSLPQPELKSYIGKERPKRVTQRKGKRSGQNDAGNVMARAGSLGD